MSDLDDWRMWRVLLMKLHDWLCFIIDKVEWNKYNAYIPTSTPTVPPASDPTYLYVVDKVE